ncbi:MAG: hypothetical protein JKY52_20040 [Flavobacteriales bacterium]|nr:hypothetical protein [Flavobacteriales bacterium]
MKLVLFDEWVNFKFGPQLNWLFRLDDEFGEKGVTLSEVFGRNKHHCNLCRIFCLGLHAMDEHHCSNAVKNAENEKEGGS